MKSLFVILKSQFWFVLPVTEYNLAVFFWRKRTCHYDHYIEMTRSWTKNVNLVPHSSSNMMPRFKELVSKINVLRLKVIWFVEVRILRFNGRQDHPIYRFAIYMDLYYGVIYSLKLIVISRTLRRRWKKIFTTKQKKLIVKFVDLRLKISKKDLTSVSDVKAIICPMFYLSIKFSFQ